MGSHPAYIFAGGVSHTPVFFESIVAALKEKGVEAVGIDYPTVGENTENKGVQDEIEAIREAALRFLDEKNKDVVLVMHSSGGWPGSRAVHDLDKEARTRNGKTTGIVELVFLAGLLIPENAPMEHLSNLPPWVDVLENGTRIPNEQCIPLLFSDLSEEDQKYWFSQLKPQRNDFAGEVIAGAPWHLSVPKTFIFCTEDCGAPITFQLGQLVNIADKTWSFKSLKAGHESFLSKPKELAAVLLTPTF